MITTNEKWNYRVNFVKFPKEQYTSCSVGVKDKESGEYVNYSLFMLSRLDGLQDGDSVRIKEIISTELAYRNDKPQLKVTCVMEIVNKANQGELVTNFDQSYEAVEPTLSIEDDSLPF